MLLPIHWGTFNLAFHPWAEPGEWTPAAAEAVGQAVALPVPGQPFEPAGEIPSRPWWRDVSQTVTRAWPVPELVPKATRGLDPVGEDWLPVDVEELGRVTDEPAAMAETEREQDLRAIDGPPRRRQREQSSECRPLPRTRGSGVSVRVRMNAAPR